MTKKIVLVFLVTGIVMVCAQNSLLAQNGTCPDETSAVQTPPGWWPGSMATCHYGDGSVELFYDPAFPCGGGMDVTASLFGNVDLIYLVPPVSMPFPEDAADVRFYLSAETVIGTQITTDFFLHVKSYSAAGQLIFSQSLNSALYTAYDPPDGGYFWYFLLVPDMQAGGYVTIQPEINWPLGVPGRVQLTSVRFAPWSSQGSGIAPMCPIPGVPTFTPTPTVTNTPTNTPTGSPTPTNTSTIDPTATNSPTPTRTPGPTNTTIPYPTGNPGTITPQPTRTPPSVPTVVPQNTPTRLPVANLPTISLPVLYTPAAADFGTPEPFGDLALTPNATAAAQATQMAEWSSGNLAVVTRWYTTTVFAAGSFSTTITGTAGFSTVVEIAGTLGESVAAPFSYVRLVQTYLPNLWPLVLFLLLAVGWIFVNLVAKYAISIIGNLGELIRRLIELLPGF